MLGHIEKTFVEECNTPEHTLDGLGYVASRVLRFASRKSHNLGSEERIRRLSCNIRFSERAREGQGHVRTHLNENRQERKELSLCPSNSIILLERNRIPVPETDRVFVRVRAWHSSSGNDDRENHESKECDDLDQGEPEFGLSNGTKSLISTPRLRKDRLN